jgi:hypothetical protein
MGIPTGRIKTHHLVLWIASKTMGIMSNLKVTIGVDVHNNQRKKEKEKETLRLLLLVQLQMGGSQVLSRGSLGFRV